MYCAKCGVELLRGATNCPLCGLRAYHPDLPEESKELAYPAYHRPSKQHSQHMIPVTALLLIPMILCLAIDIRISGHIVWSGYVIGGILCAYVSFLLPLWFRKRNPVIFFPIAMTSVMLLVLYISQKSGGKWFLSFAFPVIMVLTLLLETMIVLLRYAVQQKKNRILVISGSGSIAAGAFCILMEFLIHVTFSVRMIGWSFIPFIVLFILGGIMIALGIHPAFRENIYKKFFI